MSVAVIVMVDTSHMNLDEGEEFELDAQCYCQNLAVEAGMGLLDKLAERNGTRLNTMLDLDWEGDDESLKYYPASEVLAEVKKAKLAAASLDDDAFEMGKAPLLEDIDDLEKNVVEAEGKSLNVALILG